MRESGTRIGGASQQPVWSWAWAWAVARMWQAMARKICAIASRARPYGGQEWGTNKGKEYRFAVAESGGLCERRQWDRMALLGVDGTQLILRAWRDRPMP